MSLVNATQTYEWLTRTGAGSAENRVILIQPLGSGSLELRVARQTGSQLVELCRRRFIQRGHQDYIDFYAGLADCLGTTKPPAFLLKGPDRSDSALIPLLTANLSPQIRFGYGDPAALRIENSGDCRGGVCYYVAVTSNDAPDAFPLVRSRDLATWEVSGFVFPRGQTPAWALVGEGVADYWAPEMHKVGEEYRVYFVARDKETRELCVGLAKATSPQGPFVAEPTPLLRNERIDPHLFNASEDKQYLYWKEDANGLWPQMLAEFLAAEPENIELLFDTADQTHTASFIAALSSWTATLSPMERFFALQPLLQIATIDFGEFRMRLRRVSEESRSEQVRDKAAQILQTLTTHVYAQLLDPTGTRLLGSPVKVLENDQKWEAHVIEGMWVTKRNDRYYMFYSGNDFSTPEYGIGVAVSHSPLGPFEKSPHPLLGSNHQWIGPGHPSVAIGPKGETLLFFHAYVPKETGYKKFRALLCAVLDFSGPFPTLRTDITAL